MEKHKYINFGKREILELDQKKFHSLLKSTGNAARTVLAAVFGSRRPADRVLSTWFRDNRRCGSRDRRFISESIYALLRNWGLLRRFLPAERLAEIESGTIRLGARNSTPCSSAPSTLMRTICRPPDFWPGS